MTVNPEARPTSLDDLSQYDFDLPQASVAQNGLAERDAARLLILDRAAPGSYVHSSVSTLPSQLREGDLLVMNTSRVLPARLRGHKSSGGRAEALLLGPAPLPLSRETGATDPPATYRALVGCRGRLRTGLKLRFEGRLCDATTAALDAEVVAVTEGGEVWLSFPPGSDPYTLGQAPLPPYIARGLESADEVAEDLERYQTVYAEQPGSVAAPTAGLHFTPQLLETLRASGVRTARCSLHVGPGTFRPLGSDALATGRLHTECFELPPETASEIASTRSRGGRVIAVGTTTTRVLEACAAEGRQVEPRKGATDLFLRPGDPLRIVDGLLTNFHLPRSSLLLLVAAFAGRRAVLDAYAEAIREGYRFYSYGDAMLIL